MEVGVGEGRVGGGTGGGRWMRKEEEEGGGGKPGIKRVVIVEPSFVVGSGIGDRGIVGGGGRLVRAT